MKTLSTLRVGLQSAHFTKTFRSTAVTSLWLRSCDVRAIHLSKRTFSDVTDAGWKPRLVIFDKNGTLICVNSPWVPWVTSFAQRLEQQTGQPLRDDLLSHLNVCLFTNKVRSGILAHGTSNQIKAEVREFLQQRGMTSAAAWQVVGDCWQECDTSDPTMLKELAGLKQLFTDIRKHDVKIAVCTSDGRRTTERTLSALRLIDDVSAMACGDDHDAECIRHLCDVTGVEPRDAVMIGDTEDDLIMARDAGVGLKIGVLSGTGNRLELSQHADVIVANVRESLPYILQSSEQSAHARRSRKQRRSERKTGAVIFDKDGTLLCFNSLWTPWMDDVMERLERATGLTLYDDVMRGLGFCVERRRWQPGVFAEGTEKQSRDVVMEVLLARGLSDAEATDALRVAWDNGINPYDSPNLKVLGEPLKLFATLKAHGIKIAICTADSRPGTLKFLDSIGVTSYVDLVVCGDDPQSEPKPSPRNALAICRQLDVDPSRVVVVGDTHADMGMGRSAGLGATVGVLTGVGDVTDLDDHADYIVPHVGDILPLILNKRTATGSGGEGN